MSSVRLIAFASMACVDSTTASAGTPRRAIDLAVRASESYSLYEGLHAGYSFELLVDACCWRRGTPATAEILGATRSSELQGAKTRRPSAYRPRTMARLVGERSYPLTQHAPEEEGRR